MEEYIWLILAVVILVVALWRPVKRIVTKALDDRAERIRKELDDAKRLHEEARAMLARFEHQLHEGEVLAKEVLDRAETERQRVESRLRTDFEALTERRTQQALERIAQEESRAVAELRARAATLAVRATRALLEQRMEGADAERVMQSAVGEVTRKLAS